MAKKSDPTKDPEFQKVVSHFLKTPPKHHKDAPDDTPKRGNPSRRKGVVRKRKD